MKGKEEIASLDNLGNDIIGLRKSIVSLSDKLSSLEVRIKRFEDQRDNKSEDLSQTGYSPSRFLESKKPASEREAILALAVHEEINNGGPLNKEDLEKLFFEAREPVPKNINSLINRNIEKGLFMQAKEKKNGMKAFHVTRLGMHYVDKRMPSGKAS